jgi:peptide/nickel transport system permease protein
MLRLIVRRTVSAIPVLILVVLIAFSLMRLVPGDPTLVMGGLQSTQQEREAMRVAMGLDKPAHVQLWRWIVGLSEGNLGRSVMLGIDVSEAAAQRIPVTLSISLYAMLITLVLGIAAGVVAALRHNTWVDQVLMTGAVAGVSMPNFWLALMLIVLFGVQLRWLPIGGYVPFMQDPIGWWRSATLPALSLGLLQVGLLARMVRSTMLDVLGQDYIRTARAKGLSATRTVLKHAFTNTLIPVLTTIGHTFSLLMGGSIVIETVFSIPGFGLLLGSAILGRDYPVVQGGLLLFAVMLITVNVITDVLYAHLDPRVRYDEQR